MMSSYPVIRLFVEQPLHGPSHISLTEKQSHYLAHVMRRKAGDRLALFNGRDGEWLGEIASLGKKGGEVTLREQRRAYATAPDAGVCFAPVKAGRIDAIIEKCTELGAAYLQPVITARTQISRVNLDRLRAQAIEAAEQSERLDVPELRETVSLPHMLADWPPERLLLFADEQGSGLPAAEWFKAQQRPEQWALLIGPEGGFTSEEAALISAQPFAKAISLGPRILRADTAAISLLALTMAEWGDWEIKPRFDFA